MRAKLITICVPCYNEEENVQKIYDLLTDEMRKLQYNYEIIFRDNASTDNTYSILKEISCKDNKVKVIENASNYGPGPRSNTFKEYISGDVVISIACDLQDPVELIPVLLQYYEQGYDVVLGQKVGSDESKIKYFLRQLFYNIIDTFSEKKQYQHISGMNLLSRSMFDLSVEYCAHMPFRYFIADIGCPVKLVPYHQQKRMAGKSKLSLKYLFEFSLRALVLTSTKPIHFATIVGFSGAFVCLIIGIIFLIRKILYWKTFQMGIAPLIIGVFFVGSIQLFFLGLIGEYLTVVIDRVTKKPPAIVKETINTGKETDIEVK